MPYRVTSKVETVLQTKHPTRGLRRDNVDTIHMSDSTNETTKFYCFPRWHFYEVYLLLFKAKSVGIRNLKKTTVLVSEVLKNKRRIIDISSKKIIGTLSGFDHRLVGKDTVCVNLKFSAFRITFASRNYIYSKFKMTRIRSLKH